jgi:hypothetical protein
MRPSGQTPTLIAYGSLMSGLGLATLAPLPVLDACRVRLTDCRRGFGKLSLYGDRFAMVLAPSEARTPIQCTAATAGAPAGIDGLSLTLRVSELARVAQREGYRADALLALAREGERRGYGLGAFLWTLYQEAEFDVAAYRRALADVVDYTSPHYVPHPVASSGGEAAIVFLAPGPEGSGRPDVVPIRVQSAETRLLSFRRAWSLKPNASQLEYGVMCALAEVHGISLADVLGDLADYPPLASLVRERLARELPVEPERFRAALGLSQARFAACFPARG